LLQEGIERSVMNSSSIVAGLPRSWPLLVLLLAAVVWLHRLPYSASNLEVPPDTVEYALAPLQLLETGRYEIMLEGRGLPPRYPPWFSAVLILPAYVLFGHDPGNAILPVTLLAVAGVGFAYAIGRRISSTTGGVLAALALLVLPPYSAWATQVMTDVPCTALMLGTCLIYLRLRTTPKPLLPYLGAGVLVGLTTLFRPVFVAMLLPFLLAILRQRKDAFLRGLLLLAPMAGAVAAVFAYNAVTFGSPLRNGYKFWVPVPMDYPTMMFSFSHLRMNLEELGLGVAAIVLLVYIGASLPVWRRKTAAFAASRESLQHAILFFALTTAPILIFHLFYFFPAERFHIPMLASVAVLGGSMLALLIGPGKETIFKWALPVVLVLAVGARIATPAPPPFRRLAAERVRSNTPENAIAISAIDPVYLGRLAGSGSSRRIVPLSRDVDYASALLVRKRVDDPRLNLLAWDDPKASVLIRPHAEEAVHFVASERMNELAQEIARGTPVFFESTAVTGSDSKVVAELQRHFKFVQRVPYLYQLHAR
jgi:4-amino-4-deoxy-L-arabinose transferase-like glycosyltransferase